MYLLLALVAAVQQPASGPTAFGSDSIVFRVLAINDFHGALEPRVWPWSQGRPVGGAAALKPWLDSLGRECGCPGLRLDAGDEMQGTPVSNLSFGDRHFSRLFLCASQSLYAIWINRRGAQRP